MKVPERPPQIQALRANHCERTPRRRRCSSALQQPTCDEGVYMTLEPARLVALFKYLHWMSRSLSSSLLTSRTSLRQPQSRRTVFCSEPSTQSSREPSTPQSRRKALRQAKRVAKRRRCSIRNRVEAGSWTAYGSIGGGPKNAPF